MNSEQINDQIIAQFITAWIDCFRDEDDRESDAFSAIDPAGIEGNDLILAMFTAFRLVIKQLSDFEGGPLDFTNLLNHLLLQEERENAIKAVKGDDANE